MSGTWIVVADSSRARFFSWVSRVEPLLELEGMAHSEGRMRDQDEVSDRQGGIAGGHGEGGHAFEAPTDLKHHEAEVFAKLIADKLEHSRVNHDYDKLILVAPPAFLGALRHALNDHVQALVGNSLDKNLVAEDEASIREHIL
ncbi:host attachment protein [Methylomonas sp. LL1]|uniref:host attachment protein n=1 Tax=Methylomonas sp. LL1 TaxID=2785785 RepID=UPI0018C3EA99|nr:host attachment protein [Methylomonas sp. LL1]QPK62711.1 host attachment protein [Methylomonas sp. LL1]